MLLKQGVLAADALREGLDAQRAAGRPPQLGEVLVQAGLASERDVAEALEQQKRVKGKRIGEILVERGIISERVLALTLSRKFHIPFVDLDSYARNSAADEEVSAALVRKLGFLPVDTDENSFTIAISDPLGGEVVDTLRARLRKRIREVLVMPSQLKRHVDRYLATADDSDGDDNGVLIELGDEEQDAGGAEEARAAGNATSVANRIILDAISRGASDIHIEPNGKGNPILVRFRIDGECVNYREIPSAFRATLIARLKIMAKLDIAEHRRPQDGKIRFRADGRPAELRVATVPTVSGNEDVVIRVFAVSESSTIEQIGLSPRNLELFRGIIRRPHGLILCVGPTGSGKTTTLHAALRELNTGDTKIVTAEDPVEITQRGLRQLQVNSKIGLTFAVALRSFLRADPDVIMIGEMRDGETATIAVEAAQTGHLVFSTLHTNSAPETITRPIEMGVDAFSLADCILGVLAQRLVRAICPECSEPYPATRSEIEQIVGAFGGEEGFARHFGRSSGPVLELRRGRGCHNCGGSGYRGRAALHELLVVNDDLRSGIYRRVPVEEIRRSAITNGMTTLLQDGIEKVVAGRTDLKQVFAVCGR